MPLVIGLTYLTSSVAGGRTGGLWVPGLIVTAWGVATTTVLSATISVDFTAAAVLAIGLGALVATQLPRVGILQPAHDHRGCGGGWHPGAARGAGRWCLRGRVAVGVFLVLGGLWELRPAVTRPVSSGPGQRHRWRWWGRRRRARRVPVVTTTMTWWRAETFT